MSLKAHNTPAQLRRGATTLLPASSGAPLVKSTPNLGVKPVWIDGSYSCDYDMPRKHLRRHLTTAFERLVGWKQMEGYQLIPFRKALRAPRNDGHSWKPFDGGRFYWDGPFEALVIGRMLQVNEYNDRGEIVKAEAARQMTTGEAHLHETGGKIAYRVGAWFVTKEHIAEVRVSNARS